MRFHLPKPGCQLAGAFRTKNSLERKREAYLSCSPIDYRRVDAITAAFSSRMSRWSPANGRRATLAAGDALLAR